MALSYDQRKKSYDSMDDSQKQQYNEAIKNRGDDYIGNQYMKQYNQQTNNTPQSNNNSSNFNNQNGTNGGNDVSTDQFTNFVKGGIEGYNSAINNSKNNSNEVHDYFNDFNNKVEEYKKTHPERDSTEYDNYKKQFDSYGTYSPDLDQTKFNQDPGKITVQEGTAQQTGRPDYQANSEARLNEMKGNLDHYFATSPRMFSDRETFNRVFEYNNRDSEAQRQLLDSYWKRKEDMDKASTYTSGESINTGMKNGEITTDQLNLLKEYNPEAYRKWQQLQEDEIKKRIVNDIVPPTIEAISGKINGMIEALGIQAQDALDIEGIYNDTMTKVGAYQTLEDCNRTVKEIEAITNKKTAIMNRYAASTGGTVSDALAAARMQKAIAPYNEQLQGLQYQYQDYSNLYSQKSATALQAANVRALQANENQRIWNQKCQALGFATSALSYRTPEENKQLELQFQQAMNDMSLLQQSRQNDLALYNQYATAKLNNQLQSELTDLSVTDPTQLKANLNNALSTYYQQYGDIIQRSQAQTVDDIIAYAKKKGISVAQAMTENFIKPLQNKAEYKQKVATDYGMLSKQSIGTINGRSVIMTTNPNGSISYQFIDDNGAAIESTYKVGNTEYVKLYNGETMTAEEYNKQYGGNIKAYNQVDSRAFTADPISTGYEGKTLYDFLNDPKNKAGNTGGQCAAFVNRYLESIGVGKYYGLEDVKTRENRCNSDTPQVGTIAVFDYNHYTDGKNYGHVAIVTKTYADGSFDVIDSNYDTKNPGKITKRHINAGTSSLKGFFDPSKPASVISSGESETFEWGGNTYNLSGYSGWNDLTETEKDTVVNLLTYQTDPASLPKSGKDNGASNQKVRAAAASIGRDFGYSERKYSLVKNAEKAWDDKSLKGDISRNATSVSILKNLADSYGELNNGNIQSVNKWINNIKTEFGDDVTLTVASNMKVAAEEIAGALKGGASPSQEDTQRILDLFNGNLSNAQAQSIFRAFAKDLLDKNMTEAQRFRQTTGYKPYSIYTDEVSDRVYNDMGLTDLAKYYDYTPVNAYTSGPQDQIYDLWKDDFEDNYGVDYDYAYSLVNG